MCVPSSLKHGHGHSKNWKNFKGWETKNNEEIIPTEKTKTRDVGRVPDKNEYDGQDVVEADEASLFCMERLRKACVPCDGYASKKRMR